MNHIGYLTPQENIFEISSQSIKPFNLKVGEHRDIESQNYYIDERLEFNSHVFINTAPSFCFIVQTVRGQKPCEKRQRIMKKFSLFPGMLFDCIAMIFPPFFFILKIKIDLNNKPEMKIGFAVETRTGCWEYQLCFIDHNFSPETLILSQVY